MAQYRHPRFAKSSFLVIEQPGSLIFFSGLLISIALGLTINAVFSPSRIQFEVEKVIQESRPKADIKIEKSYLSLAEGVWPRFAIMVEGIQIISDDPCVGKVSAHLNSLEVPVSIRSLFARKLVISDLYLDQLQVDIREEVHCVPLNSEQKTSISNSNSDLDTVEGNFKEGPLVKTVTIEAPALEGIQVNQLKLSYQPRQGVILTLNDVKIDVAPEKESKGVLNSDFELSHLSIPSERNLRGRVSIDYRVTERVEGRLLGTWREGFYEFNLDFGVKKPALDYKLNGVLKHIPLSQILPLLNFYKVMSNSYSGRQAWISSELMATPEYVDFTGFKFEGEFGEILTSGFRYNQKDGTQFNPFKVDFKKVDIGLLGQTFDVKNPLQFIQKLGVVEGVLAVRNQDDIRFDGKLTDTEFIFSNKGRRVSQGLETADIRLSKDHETVEAWVQNLALKDGFFDGRLFVKTDQLMEKIQFESQIKRLVLSAPVENLMTSGGFFGPIEGQVNTTLVKGKPSSLNGRLFFKSGRVEKIEMANMEIQAKMDEKSEVKVVLSADSLDFSSQDRVRQFLSSISQVENLLKLKNLNGKINMLLNDELEWQSLRASSISSPSLSLMTEGRWNSQGAITGGLIVQESKKQLKKIISGNRNSPILVEEK